jgi:hypothetical protein
MKRKRIVEAEEFRLVDSDHNLRLRISTWPTDGQPLIQLFDPNSLPRVSIGVEGGNAHVTLLHSDGNASVGIFMREDGRIGISVTRKSGEKVFFAGVDVNGEAVVQPSTK